MPLVCADWDRAQSLKEYAQAIANNSDQTISLVKFENYSHIEDFNTEKEDT
jgi:hypothetical protein